MRADGLELQTLQDLGLVHAPLNIRLVGEDEKTGARESLDDASATNDGQQSINASMRN